MINLNDVRHYNLVLTKDCNMDCIYCVQCGKKRTIKDDAIINEYTPKELCKLFPENAPSDIVFFGGEPLLKFDYMVEFTKLLKEKNPDVKFSVVTNGSLLTMEKVKLINDLGIRVTISHDGICYEKTRRNKDILQTKGKIIAAIKKLGFICVISNENWDFYKNWEYFENFRRKYGIKRPTVCLTGTRDTTGHIADDLLVYENKNFEIMLDKVFVNLKRSIIEKNYESYEYKCFKRSIERIYYEGMLGHGVTSCLHKKDILNVDTFGNIYRCQNILDEIDGSISDLENVTETVNELAERCKTCEIAWMCPKCPRVLEDKRKYYCYFQRQVFSRFLKMFNELIEEGAEI